MSGAQAKIFMSCGRLLAWPFGVEMWEDWEMAPGRCKVHGFLLSDFFYFTLLYFTSDYFVFFKFSPVVCREKKLEEPVRLKSGCFERD